MDVTSAVVTSFSLMSISWERLEARYPLTMLESDPYELVDVGGR
jgi:hypothetical protein